MIWHKVVGPGFRITRTTGVATRFGTDSIDLITLFLGKISSCSSGSYRFTCKWTWSNTHTPKLIKSRLCLPGLRLSRGYQPFNTSVQAWRRPPIRIDFANSPDRLIRPRLGYRKTRSLAWCWLDEIVADTNRTTWSVCRVLLTRLR